MSTNVRKTGTSLARETITARQTLPPPVCLRGGEILRSSRSVVKETVMDRLLKIAVLGLALWTLLCSVAFGQMLEGGYLRSESDRLMLKLPPGTWHEVEEAPAAFGAVISDRSPSLILTDSTEKIIILLWTDFTFRDYSRRPVSAYTEVGRFVEKRRKMARAIPVYRYFEYDFVGEGVIRARSEMAAKADTLDVRGVGACLLFFRDNDSYFYYVELLAETPALSTIKGGFLEALRATYAY
jgi:hypothetical protein